MKPYYEDDQVTLLLGDAKQEAVNLQPASIQTIITSPPYFGLRDYGTSNQIGAEETPRDFIHNLVAVFQALRPALKEDGVLWVNLGDSYAKTQSNNGGYSKSSRLAGFTSANTKARIANESGERWQIDAGRPNKSLLGIPWQFAFAMQDAGWLLRNDIIWHNQKRMPESVTDRFSVKHEHIFMFTKHASYKFYLDAVREPHLTREIYEGRNEDGKNPGDVWGIVSQPFSGAHFATFPQELPERCIKASTVPGDTVLDPFSGSATTGLVATKLGRRYIGIDVNSDYHDLALGTRLSQQTLAWESGGAA